ncbi:hypothetical protein [Actinophytocola sp.]|jgi:hypothetical protein|uniref:hypothetical protein n=1 Tax=Actinophytocola sp. TaxID=1872138 RepID=UPI002EDA1320
MDDLVGRLCAGEHPVQLGGRDPSAARLHERIRDQGSVFVRFPDTRGGTELLVSLDPGATRADAADFERGTGRVHLEGTLSLNEVPVRCVADLELESLRGTGLLVATADLR